MTIDGCVTVPMHRPASRQQVTGGRDWPATNNVERRSKVPPIVCIRRRLSRLNLPPRFFNRLQPIHVEPWLERQKKGIKECLSPSSPKFLSTFECMGFMRGSEDPSEPAFLLVENYNYDCSCWSFGSARNFCNHILFALH